MSSRDDDGPTRRSRSPGPHVSINLHVRDLPPSPTVASAAVCDSLEARGVRVARLGLGQSPFPVPPPVVAALRANAEQKAYLPVEGLPALRDAVAAYLRRRHDLAYGPEHVLVAPGSKELLFLLQVAYYGELLVPTPAWVSYGPQAQIVGRQPTFLPARRPGAWRLDPDELDALCRKDPDRPRLLVLNYPCNPTSGTYVAGELEQIAVVARRYGVVVLSDEIYGELHHEGAHVSIAQFYPEGTIISTGLSKWCGAGGWRLGCFAFPPGLEPLRRAMAAVASETYTSTSAPIQYAAVHAFQPSIEIERYLVQARRILASVTGACARKLLHAGARVELPTAAFYLFPDFTTHAARLAERDVTTSDELARRLLSDAGVALLPGTAFGRPPHELSLRISAVDFDGARALALAEAGEAAIGVDQAATLAPRVLEAIDRIAAWLGG